MHNPYSLRQPDELGRIAHEGTISAREGAVAELVRRASSERQIERLTGRLEALVVDDADVLDSVLLERLLTVVSEALGLVATFRYLGPRTLGTGAIAAAARAAADADVNVEIVDEDPDRMWLGGESPPPVDVLRLLAEARDAHQRAEAGRDSVLTMLRTVDQAELLGPVEDLTLTATSLIAAVDELIGAVASIEKRSR